jgi:hypothetical protein
MASEAKPCSVSGGFLGRGVAALLAMTMIELDAR